MNRRTSCGAALVLAALVVASCGGGGGGAPKVDTDAFLDDAETICREGKQRIADLTPPDSLAEYAAYVRDAADETDAIRELLAELSPPADLERDWESLLDEMDKVREGAEEVADVADQGDVTATVEAANAFGTAVNEDMAQAAEDVGADRCAFNPIAVFVPDETDTTIPPTTDPTTTDPPTTDPPTTDPTTEGLKSPTQLNLQPVTGFTFEEESDEFVQAWIGDLNNSSDTMRALSGIVGGIVVRDPAGTFQCTIGWFFSGTLPPTATADSLEFMAGSSTPEPANEALAIGWEWDNDQGHVFFGSLGTSVIIVFPASADLTAPCITAYVEANAAQAGG